IRNVHPSGSPSPYQIRPVTGSFASAGGTARISRWKLPSSDDQANGLMSSQRSRSGGPSMHRASIDSTSNRNPSGPLSEHERQASVDDDRRPGDVAGRRRGEENGDCGDLLGASRPLGRNGLLEASA